MKVSELITKLSVLEPTLEIQLRDSRFDQWCDIFEVELLSKNEEEANWTFVSTDDLHFIGIR